MLKTAAWKKAIKALPPVANVPWTFSFLMAHPVDSSVQTINR
jgi:hypothetical protein